MKIWFGYGSEHSANIVLVGKFKSAEDAKRTLAIVNAICTAANEDVETGALDHHWSRAEEFSDATERRLRELTQYTLSPSDISDFAIVGNAFRQSGDQLEMHTDEIDIGGYVKLLVQNGAAVEVYSAHDYPMDASEE